MSNTIRIKRRANGGGAGAPATLANAELAYNEQTDILYYGKGTGGQGGTATAAEAIGGKGSFVDLSSAQSIGGAKTFTGAATFSSTVAVQAPTAGSHAATKDYVDSLVVGGGTVWLSPVVAATTANSPLVGVPAQIDGVVVSAGQRVLVRAQTAAAENGLYIVSFSNWTRTTDFDSSAEAVPGASVYVTSGGTLYGGTQWTLTTSGTITLGTTPLTFTQIFGGQSDTGKNVGDSGVGLFRDKVGNEIEIRRLDVESGSGLGVDTPAGLNGSARITISSIPVAKGGTGATTQSGARTNLGLGSAATAESSSFAAASHAHGNITNAGAIGTTANLPIITGTSGVLQAGSFGTAAGTFCQGNDSRLANNQPLDATLTALAGVTTAANKLIYATGADAFTTTDLSSFGRSIIDDADAAAGRDTLGLGSMATQAASSVSITGGTIAGCTIDGGTF